MFYCEADYLKEIVGIVSLSGIGKCEVYTNNRFEGYIPHFHVKSIKKDKFECYICLFEPKYFNHQFKGFKSHRKPNKKFLGTQQLIELIEFLNTKKDDLTNWDKLAIGYIMDNQNQLTLQYTVDDFVNHVCDMPDYYGLVSKETRDDVFILYDKNNPDISYIDTIYITNLGPCELLSKGNEGYKHHFHLVSKKENKYDIPISLTEASYVDHGEDIYFLNKEQIDDLINELKKPTDCFDSLWADLLATFESHQDDCIAIEHIDYKSIKMPDYNELMNKNIIKDTFYTRKEN